MNQNDVNQIKYVTNFFSTNGTAFVDTTVEAILKHCESLPINGKKGAYGAIYVYESDRLGDHPDDTKSTGVILIDIDNINKETADAIFDNFQNLFAIWPSLLAIQFSASYFIQPDVKCGLHVYVKSHKIDKNEYNKQEQICLAIFAQLVYKHLNIDLKSMGTKDHPVLDFHQINMYQRFGIYHSPFKYNNYAIPFELDMVTFDELEKLVIKYDLKLSNNIEYTICPIPKNATFGDKRNKLKIDRNMHIGKDSGNSIRFKISIIADLLFGDNAKSFCDKFFYFGDGQSIYGHYSKANYMDPLIYKWLTKNGYIVERKQNIITNWIDEYANDIAYIIQKNRMIEIVAPTGSGKTTFINYDLAHRFNSVVIVPFNVTNKLYDKLFEVNAAYTGKIPSNKPIVMVWDQAIKHWNEIKDRHFIIDEAHTLFFDRTYRDAAIKFMLKLKEDDCWATFITATPAGESKLLDMKQIHYYKDRPFITLNIKATKNIEWAQYNYIKKCLDNNWYDKIVLLDDMTAKKIYEKFMINGYGSDICYIRSSTKESEDFIDLRTNELLKKRLTICTCVAFNGLNFKNEGESILVVGSIQQGQTTSCEIIQQIGRIRNSKVTGIYFYNPEKTYSDDIDERKEKAQEFNQLMLNGAPDTFLSYDRRYLNDNYVNALKEIKEYQEQHSNITTIVNELSATGYITGEYEKEFKKEEESMRMNLAIKRKESNEMKADILNNEFQDKEYDGEYKWKWAQDINYMITNQSYTGITIDTFIEMFKKGTKNKLVETIINNIKEIIRILQVDKKEYDKFISNLPLYASMLSSHIDKKKFMSNAKHIKKIRENYEGKVKFNDNSIDLTEIIQDVIQWEEENQKKEIEGNKKGGNKGHTITIDGVEYSTVKEAAEKLNTSRSQIYRMIK